MVKIKVKLKEILHLNTLEFVTIARDLYIIEKLRPLNIIHHNIDNIHHNIHQYYTSYYDVYYIKSRNTWGVRIVKNYKLVFTKHNKNKEYVARIRDLYIINNFKNDIYDLNFDWTENEINEWKINLSM